VTGDVGIELVAPDGTALADISGLASGRRWSRRRNNSDYVEFSLSLDAWEAYCEKLGVHPRELLRLSWAEVRLREREAYLVGGRIEWLKTSLSAGTINVRALGFLDMLKHRRTDALREFDDTEGTEIAWTLIEESQALPNGNLYITQGPNQATAGLHDRTYKRTVIKDALQALTAVQTNPFDFEITPFKEFNTYLKLGSERPDIVFKWGINILSAELTEDTTDLVNDVTALGSGFGDDAQAQVVMSNDASQVDYGLSQEVIMENADDNSRGGLDNEAKRYLAAWSTPVILIDVTVDGGKPPFVTDYGLGDYVQIDLTGHPWLDGIVGMFRIQEQACEISDDGQKTVTLTVSA
jgi:hypothetical protein